MDKQPIKLRKRKLPSGRTSLYLDIYRNGVRTYEYLKLYLIPEKNRKDKEANRKTLQLAETIRAKKIVDLHNGEYELKEGFAEETLFWDYYKAMCEKRRGEETRSNWGNWYSAMKHIRKYDPKIETRTFKEINAVWLEGFRNYLLNDAYAFQHDIRNRVKDVRLSNNSCQSYFNKVRACLNHAFDNRIIRFNPVRSVERIATEENVRMYLTIKELQTLAKTPCESKSVRDAFLFSCLTGLRRSDIAKMKWKEVQEQGQYTRIIFKQKKTKGLEYLDISKQASDLLGKRGEPDDYVFDDFYSPSTTNSYIQRWVLRAGIQKDITFHCGRHTFATMMLDLGTDLYTVSKLLGHKDISTTQIYTKVMDKNKQSAVEAIPNILNDVKELDF